MYNNRPLTINTTEYVRDGNLVERATHLCETYEEAQQLKYALALTRNIDASLIKVETYSSNVSMWLPVMSDNLNHLLAQEKKFSGKGLKFNTIELPAKYKANTYQGKSGNNPLGVRPNVDKQTLRSLKTGRKIRRFVDRSGMKEYLNNMKKKGPVDSVYFAESAQRSKGQTVIKSKRSTKPEQYGAQEQFNKIARLHSGTLSISDAMLASIRKKHEDGMGKRKIRIYLRSKGFSARHAQSLVNQL